MTSQVFFVTQMKQKKNELHPIEFLTRLWYCIFDFERIILVYVFNILKNG